MVSFTWNKKNTIAIIWIIVLFAMLICEWILVAIPHVGGLNVASSQIAGTEITTGTDLNSLISTTGIVTTTAQYSSAIKGLVSVMPIIFAAVIILGAVAFMAGNGREE
jgi:hypothetical protein